MPLYDYTCDECGYKEEDVRVPPDTIEQKVLCQDCGRWMKQEFPLPAEPNVVGGTEKFH